VGVGDDESGGGPFFYKVLWARLPLDVLTGLDRGLRCAEKGSGVGVGSTIQWDTVVGCSLDDHVGGGVVLTTMHAVVVVKLRCKSRVTSWLLISRLGY
jgi:hypothetical protein